MLNTFSKGLARCSGSNWVFFPDPNWLCAPGANNVRKRLHYAQSSETSAHRPHASTICVILSPLSLSRVATTLRPCRKISVTHRSVYIRCLRTRYEADEAGQCCPYGAVYQERFGCLRDNKAKNKAKQGFRAIKNLEAIEASRFFSGARYRTRIRKIRFSATNYIKLCDIQF